MRQTARSGEFGGVVADARNVSAPKLPYYLGVIRAALGKATPLLDCVIVEDMMRGEHGTLDALSAANFRASARRAFRDLTAMRADESFADVVGFLAEASAGTLDYLTGKGCV